MKGFSEGPANTPLADTEPAVLLDFPEVEHVIADRDADAGARPSPENTP